MESRTTAAFQTEMSDVDRQGAAQVLSAGLCVCLYLYLYLFIYSMLVVRVAYIVVPAYAIGDVVERTDLNLP